MGIDKQPQAVLARNDAEAAKTVGARSRGDRGGTARDRAGHRLAAFSRRYYNFGGLY